MPRLPHIKTVSHRRLTRPLRRLAGALLTFTIGLLACGEESSDTLPLGQSQLDGGMSTEDTGGANTSSTDTREGGNTTPEDTDNPSDTTADTTTAMTDTTTDTTPPEDTHTSSDTEPAPDAEPDTVVEPPPDPEGAQPIAIEASQGYLDRRAAYLDDCSTHPGIYAQCCVVAAGGDNFNDEAIDEAIERLRVRRDTADFRANGLIRMLYLDNATGALGDARRARIEQAMLDFKYWIDQPGEDGMSY
ncbi:MAG: hypothetical protein AAFX99_11965, partial [Myxococcota bacterium]